MQIAIGALFMAFDPGTMAYPGQAGNCTLENLVLETFDMIAREYEQQGVCLVLKNVADICSLSIKFSAHAAKIIERLLEGDAGMVQGGSEIIGTTIDKMVNTWGQGGISEIKTVRDFGQRNGRRSAALTTALKLTELDLEGYAALMNQAPKKVEKKGRNKICGSLLAEQHLLTW